MNSLFESVASLGSNSGERCENAARPTSEKIQTANKGAEDMEIPGVLKKEHVEILGVKIKKELGLGF